MILIFSNNEQDDETDLVCRCLLYQEVQFLRLNVNALQQDKVFVSEEKFVIGSQAYRYQDFDLVWIRRSTSNSGPLFHDDAYSRKDNLKINQYKSQEWKLFLKFFFSQFPQERMVNQAKGYFADKIDQLMLAREIGLPTPSSLYANNATLLKEYEERELIHKPAGNLGFLKKAGQTVKAYTEVVKQEQLPLDFQTSFFQEKVEAEYEIRTLYLDGELFNCGLIKSQNKAHPIDIKNQEGLRCQPVKLPAGFQAKVQQFMERLGFRIGFLDILKTSQGHRFIEMNPYGKFLYYSYSCNFNFEHRIANFFLHELRR